MFTVSDGNHSAKVDVRLWLRRFPQSMSVRYRNGWLAHPGLDHLLLGSPLRRPRVARWIILALAIAVAVGISILLGTIARLRIDVLRVFVSGLGAASVGSIVPIAILRFLDRRERESAWLYAIALLWGAFIATGLALPFNFAILSAVAEWVERHPEVKDVLGGEAALLIGAPIAGPLVEEITKGLGVLALFALLRAEFDNIRRPVDFPLEVSSLCSGPSLALPA